MRPGIEPFRSLKYPQLKPATIWALAVPGRGCRVRHIEGMHLDTFTAADLLPEFERLPSLVDGDIYVIARRPDRHGHLHVTSSHPVYVAETDSWRFPCGDCRRRDSQDLWIALDEFPTAENRAWDRNHFRTSGAFKA